MISIGKAKVCVLKSVIFVLILFANYYLVSAQIPIDAYRTEISNLKSKNDIKKYWEDLYKTDQDTLLKLPTTNMMVFDSLSICNMVRTALMFEIHGQHAHTLNNFTPTLNQAHNKIATASLLLWPIIYERLVLGSENNVMNQNDLSYELECVSMPYYNFSLLGQKKIYPQLVEKLNQLPKNSIVNSLKLIYENQKKIRKLQEVQSIGKWFLQPFKNMKEERCFEFVKMSDGSLYYRKGEYLQKLLLIDFTKNTKIYRIESEPFNWCFEFSEDKQLRLFDHNKEVLIEYSLYN